MLYCIFAIGDKGFFSFFPALAATTGADSLGWPTAWAVEPGWAGGALGRLRPGPRGQWAGRVGQARGLRPWATAMGPWADVGP